MVYGHKCHKTGPPSITQLVFFDFYLAFWLLNRIFANGNAK